jgi:dTDP-4-amino-4,6-dideoxygalactose transaminase
MKTKRILLSSPEISTIDMDALIKQSHIINSQVDVNDSINEFEKELAYFTGAANVVLLSSGTSALHLALVSLGIGKGDTVIIPTLTFAATAFPVKYVGAEPVFLDVDLDSWTLDLNLLEEFLGKCEKKSELPKLIIVVDLFGRLCNYDDLAKICDRFNIPFIVDAAESLGSKYKEVSIHPRALMSIVSFNFNKIITTMGGGALLTNNQIVANHVRKLANQARDDFHWYEHSEIGYNYRISPILAAMGRTQLGRIETIIEKRRRIRDNYLEFLGDIPGLDVNTDSHWERSNAWLSTIKLDSKFHFKGRDVVRDNLEKENIESRFIWKPLHLQPVFKSSEAILTGVSEEIFNTGLCLPSSHTLTENEILRVSKVIKKSLKGNINL